jgi:hypothetical protein
MAVDYERVARGVCGGLKPLVATALQHSLAAAMQRDVVPAFEAGT